MTGFKQVAAARGAAWLQRGWQLLHTEPRLWLAMAAVYLALAVVLVTDSGRAAGLDHLWPRFFRGRGGAAGVA